MYGTYLSKIVSIFQNLFLHFTLLSKFDLSVAKCKFVMIHCTRACVMIIFWYDKWIEWIENSISWTSLHVVKKRNRFSVLLINLQTTLCWEANLHVVQWNGGLFEIVNDTFYDKTNEPCDTSQLKVFDYNSHWYIFYYLKILPKMNETLSTEI